MANRKTPVLGYLKSAVADNTAHSSIDRLLLEDEMNQNKPMQFSGEVTPENLQTYTTKRLQSMENPSSKGRNLLIEVYDMIKPQLHRQSLMEALSQQPQHTMGVLDEPFEMRPEDALPIGGALRLLKKAKDYPKMIKALNKVANREKKRYEVMEDAARKFGPKLDAGGAKKAGKEYMTTKWIQKILDQNPF